MLEVSKSNDKSACDSFSLRIVGEEVSMVLSVFDTGISSVIIKQLSSESVTLEHPHNKFSNSS